MKPLLRVLLLTAALTWTPVRSGVWRADMAMAPTGPLSAIRAIVIRVDPSAVAFSLDTATRDERMRGAWTVDETPPSAVVALNAGQFTGGIPWGWVVRNGEEVQPPGHGSTSMAFVIDSIGRAQLVTPEELPAIRGHVQQAFQSYPALLSGNGVLPRELQSAGRGVNLAHRDSRLAIGITSDGSIIIALTRFSGMGSGGERLPFGPTVGEMAAFMRALGCRRAMLLDGGISSQLALREADGSLRRWSNFRAVPLALVITPRASVGTLDTPRGTRAR